MFIDNYKKKIKFAGHHASLCILDRSFKIGTDPGQQSCLKAYIIDSDNITNRNKDVVYSEQKYEDYLCEKVKYSIKRLLGLHVNPGLSVLNPKDLCNFPVEFLDVKTPQSITKDDYCIFWSFALTEELLRSFGSRAHSVLGSNSSIQDNKVVLDETDFNPSKILEKFMKKYKSKKQLKNYISNYILTHF